MSLLYFTNVGDNRQFRKVEITDAECLPIVCPVSELCMYSGANLAATVHQLKIQLSRNDPGEEFKVSQHFRRIFKTNVKDL